VEDVLRGRERLPGRHHAANLVAVVDAARVQNPPVAVDEHHLRRDRRVEGLSEAEIRVEVDRERDAELPAVGRDLPGVVAFADHADEADAIVGEFRSQLAKHRSILLRQRAGWMEKREADGPTIGADQIGERNGAAIHRSQCEALGRQGRGRFGRQERAGDEARQQPECGPTSDHDGHHTRSPGDRSPCRRHGGAG
jgi:hypothetical protein